MKPKTYKETYPTGRKHCSKCGAWRHLLDFCVRKYAEDRETAVYLASWCTYCMARAQRARTGHKPRVRVNYTSKPERTKALNKASRQKRMLDPNYREKVNEYQRIWRDAKAREKGMKVHRRKQKMFMPRSGDVDVGPLLRLVKVSSMTEAEQHHVALARRSTSGKISLTAVDRILTRLHLHDQLEILYPEGEP